MRKQRADMISFDSFCAVFHTSYFSLSEDTGAEEKYYELREKKNSMEILFRKELLKNLSEEAKFVVKMLTLSSEEFLDSLSPPTYLRPTRTSVRRHLHSEGWKTKEIEEVFAELKGYCRELNHLT